MDSYNYSRLLGRIKEKGFTQSSLAATVGISETSLNLKLNNKGLFRQDEIVKIAEALDIPMTVCDQYFFAH